LLLQRVSTANNGQNPEVQLRELREYIERRGWKLAGEYTDVGISGAKEKRPELDRLLAKAHRRHFDAVIVRKSLLGFPIREYESPPLCDSPRPEYMPLLCSRRLLDHAKAGDGS